MEKRMFKKLDEDDILEIVLDHFQEAYGYENARGNLFGSPGEDLRFVGVFGKENDSEIYNCDLSKLDKENDFNGDHSFLMDHPDFHIDASDLNIQQDDDF